MRSNTKKILIIIAALGLGGLLYSTGYQAGTHMAKERCIEAVTDNCQKICGVGADFYFLDKQDRQLNDYENPDQDSLIARKENYDYPPLPTWSYR